VREQERHQVGEGRDARDASFLGAPRQQGNLHAPLLEQLLRGAQLQRGNVGRRLVVGRVRGEDHVEQLLSDRCHERINLSI